MVSSSQDAIPGEHVHHQAVHLAPHHDSLTGTKPCEGVGRGAREDCLHTANTLAVERDVGSAENILCYRLDRASMSNVFPLNAWSAAISFRSYAAMRRLACIFFRLILADKRGRLNTALS
jgi:hypothetical protein